MTETALGPSDQLTWLVCPYLIGSSGQACQKCPRFEKHLKYGQTVRECRMMAEEVVNIVQTGNPWGRPYPAMASAIDQLLALRRDCPDGVATVST